MNRSDLIERLIQRYSHLPPQAIEEAIKVLIAQLAESLAAGQRIEIRGFGSFCLRYRKERIGRNPKTGEAVVVPPTHTPHFKPGKDLRERVKERVSDRSEEEG